MRWSTLLIGFLLISAFSCDKKVNSHLKTNEDSMQSKTSQLKVMTYNMRLDIASDGDNAWPNRKEFFSSQLLFLEPDIFGVQEARPNQIEDLKSTFVNYKYIGTGRDGNNSGEYSAIYYNSNKIKVEQEHTFWLSQTPNEISKGWDAAYPRICTYGLFTHLAYNSKIWVFNTHLDHVGVEAQKEGIKLIIKKIKAINTQNLPVILMGDFNVEPNSEVIASARLELNDSKDLAKVKFGPNGTFNGFKYDEPATRRIDYILVSKSSNVEVNKYAVFSSAINFKYPSDHFPVYVELEF
nr:endonuclease/exonuclease/phosphatase family protein [uncultured Psychroserpens sp.]